MGCGVQEDHNGGDSATEDDLRWQRYVRDDDGATVGGGNYATQLETAKGCLIHHLIVLSMLKEKRHTELSTMACGGPASCYDTAMLWSSRWFTN